MGHRVKEEIPISSTVWSHQDRKHHSIPTTPAFMFSQWTFHWLNFTELLTEQSISWHWLSNIFFSLSHDLTLGLPRARFEWQAATTQNIQEWLSANWHCFVSYSFVCPRADCQASLPRIFISQFIINSNSLFNDCVSTFCQGNTLLQIEASHSAAPTSGYEGRFVQSEGSRRDVFTCSLYAKLARVLPAAYSALKYKGGVGLMSLGSGNY